MFVNVLQLCYKFDRKMCSKCANSFTFSNKFTTTVSLVLVSQGPFMIQWHTLDLPRFYIYQTAPQNNYLMGLPMFVRRIIRIYWRILIWLCLDQLNYCRPFPFYIIDNISCLSIIFFAILIHTQFEQMLYKLNTFVC